MTPGPGWTTDTIPGEGTVISWYDTHTASDLYAARFAGATGAWMLDRQYALVRDALARAGASRVLEVGGGHAQIAPRLASDGFEVTVAASAEEALARLRANSDAPRSGRPGARLTTAVSPLDALPFDDASFDAVVCVRLLCHTGDWRGLVREFCRIAAGAVIVDYPTRAGIQAVGPLLFRWKRRIEKSTHAWISFTHEEIAGAFDENGFEIARREGQFTLPMALHRLWNDADRSTRWERAFARNTWLRRNAGPVIALATRRSP